MNSDTVVLPRPGDHNTIASIKSSSNNSSGSSDGGAALVDLCMAGDNAAVEAYLDANPTADPTATRADGMSALHAAIEKGLPLQRLLAAAGETPLEELLFDGWSLLHFAAAAGGAEAFSTLKSALPKLIRATDANGRQPMHVAAVLGHAAIVKICPASDAKDIAGKTPLMLAAEEGHAEAVKLLVNVKKAQINFQDSSGNTALMLAAKLGREEVVSFLLEAGAKRTLKNSDGQTAFKMATPAAAKLIKDFATGGSSGAASSTAASSSSSSSSSADKSPSTRRRNAPSSASSPSRGGASSSSSMTAAEMRRQLKIYEQENANRADLSKKVAALEDKLARSEGELNDAVAAAQQEAEEQSQQQQARIAALEQQLAEAAKTAQQAQAGKAEAEAKAAQLEADMAAKQSESAARIASLEAAVEAAAAAKDSAAQESFAAEEKVIELEKANAELVAEKESIAQELSMLRSWKEKQQDNKFVMPEKIKVRSKSEEAMRLLEISDPSKKNKSKVVCSRL